VKLVLPQMTSCETKEATQPEVGEHHDPKVQSSVCDGGGGAAADTVTYCTDDSLASIVTCDEMIAVATAGSEGASKGVPCHDMDREFFHSPRHYNDDEENLEMEEEHPPCHTTCADLENDSAV
jgi:hypothetical protein